MKLHPAQTQIASDRHRFRVLVCGRKFGKTTLAGEEIKGCSIAKKGRRVMYLAPTLEDARKLMWDRLNRELQGAIVKSNDTRMELKVRTIDGGISDIFLGSWEKIQNYRGDEFDFIIPDEVQDYREFWVGWHEALRPTLSPREGSALFMGTPKGFTHLYDLFNVEAKDTDYKSFHFTSYDNPNVKVEEIDKAKNELSEDRFAQEYLADFRKMEGLVYKEFTREKHLFSDVNLIKGVRERIAGIDFGYTNPTCILWIDRDHDNTYWVVGEWYKTNKTNSEVIEFAKTLGLNKVYPDPAEPDRIEEMRRANLNVREVSKDIEKGIDSVRELFKTNKIRIHNSCVNLIAELETYRYPERRPNNNEPETPVKEFDHAMDALRYALFMQEPMGYENVAKTYYPKARKY